LTFSPVYCYGSKSKRGCCERLIAAAERGRSRPAVVRVPPRHRCSLTPSHASTPTRPCLRCDGLLPAMATRVAVAVAVASLGGLLAGAAPVHDEVQSLPGWEGPLPSRHFSGFLEVRPSYHLHYVFVESSGPDPTAAPVVLWLNGGPGASSFGYGYLTELGPFYAVGGNASSTTSSLPELRANPAAWTTVANVIFLETPSNVGFSFCGATAAKSEPCRGGTEGDSGGPIPFQASAWTDTSTAKLNYAALQAWYAKFPEYANNPFWIWGESYAGIYVPMLAELILNASASHPAAELGRGGQVAVPLRGIGVGNGCLGNEVGRCSAQGTRIEMSFLFGHGAISQPTYAALQAECPDFTRPNTMCERWLETASAEAGHYYGYNLYDDCGPDDQATEEHSKAEESGPHAHRTWRGHQAYKLGAAQRRTVGGSSGSHQPPPDATRFGYPCGKQNGAVRWLNNPTVRSALHVPPEEFYGYKFFLDQIAPPFNYTSDVASLVPTYRRLIPRIKVLIYNGDIDPCVPYNGNEEWTRGLGLHEVEPWHAWHSDPGTGSQIAGYQTVYEHNFTFATVKGTAPRDMHVDQKTSLDWLRFT
jgi:serine carboxypeptidase-like clade 1